MTVKLIALTPEAEKLIGYCARVSNPANQDNENIAGLLSYCVRNHHWSIFEMANMVLEVKTTRAISAQILRHRSFTFQEFSQRYATVTDKPEVPELRLQDTKNRQNSIVGLDAGKAESYALRINSLYNEIDTLYTDMVDDGIAKECARAILPMGSPTTIYMNGTIRSWMHYINLRSANGTQREHMVIAEACKEIFKKELPVIAQALGW
ncbi:thymidylate synthetase [Erwinia phage MIF8]